MGKCCDDDDVDWLLCFSYYRMINKSKAGVHVDYMNFEITKLLLTRTI